MHILIVESLQQDAQELEAIFTEKNHTVDIVSTGAQALSQVRSGTDLIVVNVELQDINGFVLCGKIKKIPTVKATPIWITSSTATTENFKQHSKLSSAADAYLSKPLDVDSIRELIDEISQVKSSVQPSSESASITQDVSEEELLFDSPEFGDAEHAEVLSPNSLLIADVAEEEELSLAGEGELDELNMSEINLFEGVDPGDNVATSLTLSSTSNKALRRSGLHAKVEESSPETEQSSASEAVSSSASEESSASEAASSSASEELSASEAASSPVSEESSASEAASLTDETSVASSSPKGPPPFKKAMHGKVSSSSPDVDVEALRAQIEELLLIEKTQQETIERQADEIVDLKAQNERLVKGFEAQNEKSGSMFLKNEELSKQLEEAQATVAKLEQQNRHRQTLHDDVSQALAKLQQAVEVLLKS